MNRRRMLAMAAAGVGLAGRPLIATAQTERPGPTLDTLTFASAAGADQACARALEAGIGGGLIDLDIFPREPDTALNELQAWSALDAASVAVVRTRGDIVKARNSGRFAAVLGCQDASILGANMISYADANLERLDQLHGLGLRVLQLTHNQRSVAGDGFQERSDGGLSRLGEAVIHRMAGLGGLIDLAHAGDRTTADALAVPDAKIVISHSGCRALYPTLRNTSDAVIRALGDRGGYFGVFMMSRWLTPRATSSVEDVVDHIRHAADVGGMALVGFGSDQPLLGDPAPQSEKVAALVAYQARNAGLPGAEPLNGHVTCSDMDGPDRMAVLDLALARRGFTAAERDGVLGGNFARTLDAALPAVSTD